MEMLVPFFFVIFTVSVQSQPAAQGAASIADLISQAEGGKASDSFSGKWSRSTFLENAINHFYLLDAL